MRAAAVAVASCLSMMPWLAEAASLGKITVLSNLGQPLRAEVEVGATRDELAGMIVQMAPRDSFRQAGVDYVSALSDLRFTLDKRPNGTSVVRISSSKPINEPFLDFLVELNWPAGRLVREYTFLLDPPEVAAKLAGKAVSVAEAKPVASVRGGTEAEQPAPTLKLAPKEAPLPKESAPKPEPKQAAKPKAAETETRKTEEPAGTRLVKQGETLRKIAAENQYEGVSLEQMLVGLYRANADAFIGGNLNRMKAGAILNVPDKDSVSAIPQEEAKKVYFAQAADWNAYRRKLAAAAAQGPAREEAASQSAGGKITAKVEEKASPVESQKDQVKVSRTEAAGKPAVAGAGKLPDENQIAKDKALKEAQERLALLEKNVTDLQKLVEMKNQNLAELQKQAAAKKPEEQKAPVAAVKPAEPPKAPEPAKAVEAPKPVEAAKPAEPPKAPEPAPAPEAAKPAEPPKAAEAPKPVEAPKPAEAPKPVAKQPLPPPAPEPEPEFIDTLLEDPLPLAGAGGILALLGAFFLVKRRRKQAAELSMASPSMASLGPNSVFRATGGQSVDTGNTTPQTTDFSQTGPGTIDTDEVDPVAEADVYMAYGRDAQAEEILLEALQKDPQRIAIHAKLLEIYAGRKSLKQFETLASELYAQTGGVGHEWEKVAALGQRLDPANPLYSAGGRAAAPAPERSESFDPEATLIISPAAAMSTMAFSQPVAQEAPQDDLSAAAEAAEPLQDLDLDLATQAPPLDVPAVEETKPADDGLMSLDFDLGLDTPVAPAEPAVAFEEPAPVAEEVPAPEISALDFDLGLEASPEPAAAAPEVTDIPDLPVEAPEAAGMDTLDFDLDIGLPGGEPVAAVEPVAEEPAPVADLSVPEPLMDDVASLETQPLADTGSELAVSDNMLDFDFDIGAPAETDISLDLPAMATAEEVPAQAEQAAADLGTIDTDGLEFDVDLSDSTVLGEAVEAPSFDMSSINLDLATDSPVEAPAVELPELGAAGAEPEAMFEMPDAKDPHWEEVNTKLDLAKAYEEMGDLEGARELLQEVLGEGTDDLVEQAKGMLERIEA